MDGSSKKPSNTSQAPQDNTDNTQVNTNEMRSHHKPKEQNAETQFWLGVMYADANGLGVVSQDYTEAAKHFLRAAQLGHANAQYNVANMYYHGQGINQDYGLAATWYIKAAQQRHIDAAFNIAIMFENGHGIEQNYGKAKSWYYEAALRSDVEAQFKLGYLYANGLGVDQDNQKAKMWYGIAANQGHQLAQDYLNRLVEQNQLSQDDDNQPIIQQKNQLPSEEQLHQGDESVVTTPVLTKPSIDSFNLTEILRKQIDDHSLQQEMIASLTVSDLQKDLTGHGGNVLHYIVRKGTPTMVAWVLAALGSHTNEFVSQPNNYGKTPLHLAANHQDTATFCAMLSSLADNAATIIKQTVSHHDIKRPKLKNLNWTVVHIAAHNEGQALGDEAIEALIEKLANEASNVLSSPDSRGLTPVHLLVRDYHDNNFSLNSIEKMLDALGPKAKAVASMKVLGRGNVKLTLAQWVKQRNEQKIFDMLKAKGLVESTTKKRQLQRIDTMPGATSSLAFESSTVKAIKGQTAKRRRLDTTTNVSVAKIISQFTEIDSQSNSQSSNQASLFSNKQQESQTTSNDDQQSRIEFD